MARIQYRRRLRSRIIFSFALFGLALTALFAVSAVYLRTYLEDKLIGETLQQNLQGYADAFYGATALVAGGFMVTLAWRLWAEGAGPKAEEEAEEGGETGNG